MASPRTAARALGRSTRSLGIGAAAILVPAVLLVAPAMARAAPGQATRLGGISPQGPASYAVSALHHNPAMLAALRGTAFHVSLTGTLEQRRVRRNAIDPTTGEPTSGLQSPSSMLDPGVGFFAGGSFYFDPVAIGLGIYEVGSQYRIAAAPPVRYHLAPDPDLGCLRVGLQACKPNGGSVSYRHDLTFALAYDGGLFQLGAAVHFPMVRERFAFDNDTSLGAGSSDAGDCTNREDPACAERVGFKGWTQWIPRDGAPAGFDAALTFGASAQLAQGVVRLGARYRTFPLRRRGQVQLGGVGLVCRPDPGPGVDPQGLPSCGDASSIRATLRQRLPQEVAIGAGFLLGRGRFWGLDFNAYWLDLCQGGAWLGQCDDEGAQTLRLVGLDRSAFVLPQVKRFRGLQDVFGLDVYASWRERPRAAFLFGGHLSSPPTRPGAASAAMPDGIRVGASFGARIRLRERSRIPIYLEPGYGLDFSLPRIVRPGASAFSPSAATEFSESGGDINAEGADLVLDGRARSTNAARYFGVLHTFSLAVLWGEGAGQ
jgi:hypothetical protein